MRAKGAEKERARGRTMGSPAPKKVQRAGGGFIHRFRWLSGLALRLPRTTLGGGFDLLPLRARCTREPRGSARIVQGLRRAKIRKERTNSFCYSVGTDGTGSS